jgi:hypothetical protein
MRIVIHLGYEDTLLRKGRYGRCAWRENALTLRA